MNKKLILVGLIISILFVYFVFAQTTTNDLVSVQDGALSAGKLVVKDAGSHINIYESLDGIADPADPNDRWLIQSQKGDLYFQWNDDSTGNWVYPLTLKTDGTLNSIYLDTKKLVVKDAGSHINIYESLDGIADPADVNDNWLIQSQWGDLYFQWHDASTNKWVYPLTLKTDGNVGIGTADPRGALHVAKSTDTSLNYGIKVEKGDSTGSYQYSVAGFWGGNSSEYKTFGALGAVVGGTKAGVYGKGTDATGTPVGYAGYFLGDVYTTGGTVIKGLSGSGNAYVCVDSVGILMRSTTPCA